MRTDGSAKRSPLGASNPADGDAEGYAGTIVAHCHPRARNPSTIMAVTTLTPLTCGG